MANIKFSALIADARGAIGGVVLSRGGGGSIARTNVKPINPRSSRQQDCRARQGLLSTYWSATLTEANRESWRVYAAGTSWTNKVGTAASISGLAAFTRLNTLLLQAGEAIQAQAPAITGHAGTPIVDIAADPTDSTITVTAIGDPFSPLVVTEKVLCFVHAPANAGRKSVSGVKRYTDLIIGVVSEGPTYPVTLSSEWLFVAGQNISVSFIYINTLGQLAAAYTATVVAAVP